MGRMNKADWKKTIYYLRRNGLKKTWYAARERLEERRRPPYVWIPENEEELERQRSREPEGAVFSIVVPAYRTNAVYLKEMTESLCRQTYSKWELIVADATEDDSVERVIRSVEDDRIRYIHLEKNQGIAGNSNQALGYAKGDYVGLLDHDDILTDNALFEMAAAIRQKQRQGVLPRMLYSDEDKCNGDGTDYYEPNFKEDFNLDLLLGNNYICHFLVMERELIQRLGFRKEYEGAQDYDLVLRAVSALKTEEEAIVHIPRVLYHWRCHTGSTAENPESKLYAYRAGRRAVEDFARREGWQAKVSDISHLGFYVLEYEKTVFETRQDVGAIGGRIVCRKRIAGGRLTEEGKTMYENLPVAYSGYLHRAVLSQDAAAVDIRNMRVREECRGIFEETVGVAYRTVPGKDIFDVSLLPGDCDRTAISLKLGRALREAGYRILYLPDRTRELKISE